MLFILPKELLEFFFVLGEGSLSSSDSSYAYGVTPGICAALKVSEAEDYDSYVVCHKGKE